MKDDLEQLMMTALDDELDAHGRAALRSALAHDPALSARWVALVRQERQLRQWCQPGDGAAITRGVLAELARERAAAVRIMDEVRRVAPARKPLRRLFRQGALAAGLLLAAALGWLVVRPHHGVVIMAGQGVETTSDIGLFVVSGPVALARLGGQSASGALLSSDDHLTVGAGGSAIISGDHGATRLTLAAGTSLRVLGAGRLALDEGALAATVAPQPPARPLRIATPDAELRVVGTRFALVVAGATTLTVHEGVVAVCRAGEPAEIMVGAGAVFDSAVPGLGTGLTAVWARNDQWERIATAGTPSPSMVASQAVALSSDPSFHPDQLICLQSGIRDGGEGGDHLFLTPRAMTIDLHLRAERAGTVMVVLAPFQATRKDELHAGSKAVAVGPSWTTITIAGDALSSHAFPHGLAAGTRVWAISIFGFAAGRIELDRIVVRGDPAATP